MDHGSQRDHSHVLVKIVSFDAPRILSNKFTHTRYQRQTSLLLSYCNRDQII